MSEDMAMPSARAATPTGLSRFASSCKHCIAIARDILRWFGPFGVAVVGVSLLMVSVAMKAPNVWLAAIGGLLTLSALEGYAERAKGEERERWAKVIAGLIAEDSETVIRVQHTVESVRPELDELVAKLVAQGMETREGGDGEAAPSRSDDSPVRKDAPND